MTSLITFFDKKNGHEYKLNMHYTSQNIYFNGTNCKYTCPRSC